MTKKKICIFLDRDGVINYDEGPKSYSNPKKLLPGVVTALSKLKILKKKFKVIIISNQSAVAKGYITEQQLKKSFRESMILYKKKKIPIDDIFYCPFHPKIGNHYYKRKSYLRKPNPGMILEAKKKYNIDLTKSFMIGNSIVDYEAAIAANVYPLIINNRNINIKKKFKFSNINKAIHFIKLRIGF